jgi:galacturan 1,4-alpha-galacturonidase
MLIENIVFNDFTGTSKKYDPIVGTLVCSSSTVRYPLSFCTRYKLTMAQQACQNIVASNINVTNPSGKKVEWKCTNVDKSTLAINCV